jgi:hypothetical protein
MNPKEFELFVQNLFVSRFPSNYSTFHRKHYMGKTGQSYEIDISFEAEVGEINYITLCECKMNSLKNPVGITVVNDLISKLKDIGAHKAILITNSKFQKGVYTIAKAENIALILIKNDNLVIELPSDSSPELNKSLLYNGTSDLTKIYLYRDENDSLLNITNFFGKPFYNILFT